MSRHPPFSERPQLRGAARSREPTVADSAPTSLPTLEQFNDKFCRAVRESGVESEFLAKWGLQDLSDVERLLRENVQGGYRSYSRSILAEVEADAVLSVGPGMGLCEFLLAETCKRVFVAEPDAANCRLIGTIARNYETEDGTRADRVIKMLHAGIAITDDAIDYWDEKRKRMAGRGRHGSILNFDLRSSAELETVFEGTVERVFLHKVLSSLSIATSLADVLGTIVPFVAPGGTLTWSEPEYVFCDVLELENGQRLPEAFVAAIGNPGWECTVADYAVTSRVAEEPFDERWSLVTLRRRYRAEQ